MKLQDFYDGQEFAAHEYLGAHVTDQGVVFRTYAPAAEGVTVIGEFNNWENTELRRVENGQFWEAYVPEAQPGQMYKFRIYHHGAFTEHADPYAFRSELRPASASVIYDRHRFAFSDEAWMKERGTMKDRPLSIYELHLGSWHMKAEPNSTGEKRTEDVSPYWYSYAETAERLIPYLKENHYTCVEIMPLNEYPADESWGYQGTGFFSATARYGDPDGLKYLINALHKEGIGAILDIVTVHFAVNSYGLWEYDGTHLYEYPNPDVSHSEWGSCNFNHSRGDIMSFLHSASAFWLAEYHFDGLRFDAVGNLIYWQGNKSRGVNNSTVQFLRKMTAGLKARFPEAMLIAEDSSAFPGVTKPVSEGGLGFDYKWDMGWMNDTLDYFRTDPEKRPDAYHRLTFSMQYFYNEHYILPLSHDEVVHGKATILQKMAGGYEMKFPEARTLYLYMYTHPGKKLNFMGNEIGQFREWDEKREQDWGLLMYPAHQMFHRFMKDMNRLYGEHPALWEKDYAADGFEWYDADNAAQSIFAYTRRGKDETVFTVLNLSGTRQVYPVYLTPDTKLTVVMDTDSPVYGGLGISRYPDKTDHMGKAEFELQAFSGVSLLLG